MNLLSQIIFWIPFLFSVGILLWLWRKSVTLEPIEPKTLKRAVVGVIGLYVLQFLGRVIIFYYYLKKDPLGMYLLPDKGTNFFLQNIWGYGKPLVWAIVAAAVIALAAYLIKRYSAKPWFETNDIFIIFITCFLVGFPGVFLLLVGSLLLMIVFQLLSRLIFKTPLGENRLNIASFLLFVGLMMLILANFSFYINFLSWLHLV